MGLVLVFGVAVLALHTYIARRFPSIEPAPEPELPVSETAPKPRRREEEQQGGAGAQLRGSEHVHGSLNGAVVLVPPAEGDVVPAGAGAGAAAGRLQSTSGEASSISNGVGDSTGEGLLTCFQC